MLQEGLVVDSRFGARKELIRDLQDSGLLQHVHEARSVSDGLMRLERYSLDACVLGPTLSDGVLDNFLRRGREKAKSSNCAFIVVCHGERVLSPALESLGIHGSIQKPYSVGSFADVVKSAVSRAKGRSWDELTPQPSMRTLETLAISQQELRKHLEQSERTVPLVLQETAQRLREVSQCLLEGKLRMQRDGTPSLAASDAIRLAVEQAFLPCTKASEMGHPDHDFVESVVRWFTERIHVSHNEATARLKKRLLGVREH